MQSAVLGPVHELQNGEHLLVSCVLARCLRAAGPLGGVKVHPRATVSLQLTCGWDGGDEVHCRVAFRACRCRFCAFYQSAGGTAI